ncbi:hypothetical protein OVA11_19660 [Caulobacter sp. SL161]|uniref:hypothetical protein n=1 Tax=Caulobacter sp. SL161 TaxID=2995156 RepID=UPI002275DAA3|nr:hypothetical protein [Caulobacter sp. SL161]MCY1649192.1 hypothetical protein [Caulobacter sp. SL161]
MIYTLELRGTAVSDAEIAAIAALPRLHCIDVPNTAVTSACVARVASLVRGAANLQSLALDGNQHDAASVAALSQADRMLELFLYRPEVTSRTTMGRSEVRLREPVGLNGVVLPQDTQEVQREPEVRSVRVEQPRRVV